jgi:hypothetical protein
MTIHDNARSVVMMASTRVEVYVANQWREEPVADVVASQTCPTHTGGFMQEQAPNFVDSVSQRKPRTKVEVYVTS